MKKSSLLALSLTSLVALVGCGKQAAKTPAGKSAAQKMFKDITGEKAKFSDESPVYVEGKQFPFIDFLSDDMPEGDIFKIPDTKDSYEFCFYLFQFEKTDSGYIIEEEGKTYTFTIDAVNNIANNLLYDFFIPEDPEEEFQISYRRGKWACGEIYKALETDDAGAKISSYAEFQDGLNAEGVYDETLVTVDIACLFYLLDYVDETASKTYSFLTCTVQVYNVSDF